MAVYGFGQFEFDSDTGELRREDDRIRLRPQPAAILAHLLRHPFEVVSRRELQRVLWPDGTFVHYDHGLNSCIKQIRAALWDSRTTPSYLETLNRRGYRLIVPVTEAVDGRRTPARVARVFVCPTRTLIADERGRMASDGLGEELTARLTRISPGTVVAVAVPSGRPGEFFRIRGLPQDVDYGLTTTVRVAAGVFRVTAQLVDARDHTHVWAATYDGTNGTLLSEQARIADQIATGVVRALNEDDEASLQPTVPAARVM